MKRDITEISNGVKILIIGFGSIGKRHYQNLRNLGFNNVFVYDIDQKKTDMVPDTRCLTRVRHQEFDVAFICTPNHLHIKHALLCARAGCHLFIEKPLSHNLQGVKELLRVCQEKKLINMVACNMRFHPCLQFIKDYLSKNRLGKIYSINLEFGYYLPYWRKNQDYRENYAAKRAEGGGIILDDVHDFDLLFWFNNFTPVLEAKFVFDKISDLKIETEDISIASFKFKNKVLGSIKCDYLQQKYCRNCKVAGERGNLVWDFNENIVWLQTKKGNKNLLEVKNYDINNMYVEQIKYFLDCIKKKQKTFNDIETARNLLTSINYAK